MYSVHQLHTYFGVIFVLNVMRTAHFTFEIKSTLTNAERNTNHRLDQLSQFVQVFLPKFDMYNHLVTAMDSFGQNRELALLYVE